MSFTQFDCSSGLFDFPTESPLCDFQENGTFFSECQIVDRVDNVWLNDDKGVISIHLKSAASPPPPVRLYKSLHSERSSLQDVRKRKSLDLPKSEPLVTKTNHFICKDDFLWSDSKELPDVILGSPRKENTPEPINTFFNFDEEKSSLNYDFDNALRNVHLEVGKNYSVDVVTKEDVEYLDNLLYGFSEQPVQNFDHDFNFVQTKSEVVASDLGSFNEISCNIHQQGVVSDSKSAIKTLLKYDSFKSNFCMKKSTEILSEIDQSHDCLAEHNYFSPTKIPKPRTTPDSTSECPVAGEPSPPHVPIHSQDFVVETEVSSTPSSSVILKTPQIVLPQCSAAKTSSSSKPAKSKSREVTKHAKKPASSRADPDPTYQPNAKRRKPTKKARTPKPQVVVERPKAVSHIPKFYTCSIAQHPRIPMKPVEDPASKPVERSNLAESRIPDVEASNVPEVLSNPPTPLASPTREDLDQDEFTNPDSCQPETHDSNVDAIVDSIQAPRIEKKKISLQEYLQKRATSVKNEPESTSGSIDEFDPIDSIVVSPPRNVEEILRTIVKPEPLRIEDVLKTIVKSEPTQTEKRSNSNPVIKPEPNLEKTAIKSSIKIEPNSEKIAVKSSIKIEPNSTEIVPKPIVKCEPLIVKSKLIQKPAKEPIKLESKPDKPMSRPRRDSKPVKETVNSVPLKLIKLAIPDKASTAQSYSLSPNEISQSIDSFDRYSSSGFSSYHNSSVSSTCGSPFTAHDDKSNDTKYSDSERTTTTMTKQQPTEKKMPAIPFAVNKELLRKADRRSRKRKYKREKRRRSDSTGRKRKLSDSCFEDDSDCSDYSDRKRSRKRYPSTSSCSSDRSYHHRSNTIDCTSGVYYDYGDWRYLHPEMVPCFNYSELPNMYYPHPLLGPWHPDFVSHLPQFAPNMEVPYNYGGSHESARDTTGDCEIDRRALFVGNIEDYMTKEKLRDMFKQFGEIDHAHLHFRDPPMKNFGFVYYTDEKYVLRAIQLGRDDPNLSNYKLGRGIRNKNFYPDRRALAFEKTATNFQKPCYREREDTYNVKLEQFKSDLHQNKLNASYK